MSQSQERLPETEELQSSSKPADLALRFWRFLRGPASRLGTQITFLVTLSLVVMIASVWISTFFMADRWISRDYKSYTVAVGSMLADNVRVGVLVGSPFNAQQAIDIATSYDAVSQVAVYGLDGALLASIEPELEWKTVDTVQFASLEDAYLEYDAQDYWQYLLPVLNDNAEPMLEDQEALRQSETLIGYLRIRVLKRHFEDTRDSVVLVNILVLSLVAILLLLALRALTSALTKPLEEFVQTMRRGASTGEHHPRLSLEGSAEISQLSESFNNMMHVLEERKIDLQEARDEALTAARLKAEFAANVSHEIRTPLNGIVGTLHVLSHSKLTSEQREYISLAESASEGLIAMINAILDFSRLTLDQATLNVREFDLPELLEELLSLHAKSYNFKPLDFLFYYDEQLPNAVKGDKDKIRQLLNNLLNNATKFTDEGSIELSVKRESEAYGKVWVTISVKDTGIGLSEKDKLGIFQPYQQTDGTMSRKYGGTGLGLAICEKLTELLGGDIGVHSSEGVGSEFYVRLPFDADDSAKISANVEGFASGSMSISVVSATQSIRESATNLYRRLGIQPVVTSSLSELIDLIRAEHIDPENTFVMVYPSVIDDHAGFWKQVDAVINSLGIRMLAVTRLPSLTWQKTDKVKVLLPPLRETTLRQLTKAPIDGITLGSDEAEAPARQVPAVAKRVLLVEDNPINRVVTSRILENEHCEVVAVEDGLHALVAVKEQAFDVVLMDCQLPGMNGYETTRQIRALGDHYATLPIVAITANVDIEQRKQCFEAGMNDFIGKPIHAEDLLRILSELGSGDE